MLLFLPPRAPLSKAISYDFNAHGFEATGLSSHISQLIGKPIGYRKPFPWRTAAIFSLAAMVVTSAVLYIFAKVQASMEGQGRGGLNWRMAVGWILQLLCLATITIMCAGYMWNNIRGAPYMSMGQNGKVEYFAGGFQNQLGVETQIVASICEYMRGGERDDEVSSKLTFASSPAHSQTACSPSPSSPSRSWSLRSATLSSKGLACTCGASSSSEGSASCLPSSGSRSEYGRACIQPRALMLTFDSFATAPRTRCASSFERFAGQRRCEAVLSR